MQERPSLIKNLEESSSERNSSIGKETLLINDEDKSTVDSLKSYLEKLDTKIEKIQKIFREYFEYDSIKTGDFDQALIEYL